VGISQHAAGRLRSSAFASWPRSTQAVGRDFDRLQPEPLQSLQGYVKARRLDDNGIAGRRDCLQAKMERWHGTVGEDDLRIRDRRPMEQITLADQPPQRLIAGWQVIEAVPVIEFPHASDQGLPEIIERKQIRIGERGSERHGSSVLERSQDLVDEVVAVDDMARCLGPRRSGLVRALVLRPRADVVAGTLCSADQSAYFEKVVGLEHRGRAHAPMRTGFPNGRKPIARAQHAGQDRLLDIVREFFVESHGAICRFRTTTPCLRAPVLEMQF